MVSQYTGNGCNGKIQKMFNRSSNYYIPILCIIEDTYICWFLPLHIFMFLPLHRFTLLGCVCTMPCPELTPFVNGCLFISTLEYMYMPPFDHWCLGMRLIPLYYHSEFYKYAIDVLNMMLSSNNSYVFLNWWTVFLVYANLMVGVKLFVYIS